MYHPIMTPLAHWALGLLQRFVANKRPPDFVLQEDDGRRVYLKRWWIIPRNRWLNIYVHQFLRSDDDRALHDHPWWFVSLMLQGMYTEVTDTARTVRSAPEPWRLFFGDRPLAFRPATWRHRVELIATPEWCEIAGTMLTNGMSGVPPKREIPCWTLIITGRRVRTWGFWCKQTLLTISGRHVQSDRFVPWQEFGDAGCGEVV